MPHYVLRRSPDDLLGTRLTLIDDSITIIAITPTHDGAVIRVRSRSGVVDVPVEILDALLKLGLLVEG